MRMKKHNETQEWQQFSNSDWEFNMLRTLMEKANNLQLQMGNISRDRNS